MLFEMFLFKQYCQSENFKKPNINYLHIKRTPKLFELSMKSLRVYRYEDSKLIFFRQGYN